MYLLDIFGTFAFAISGAFRGVKHELDILGIIVLSIFTGIGGGVIRDTILISEHPSALTDQTYILTCIAGAITVFFLAPKIARRWNAVMIADAIGLSVFTVIGASVAEQSGAVPITIIIMAIVTATGGGVVRDLLVCEIPAILKSDFYATAALMGGIVYIALGSIGASEPLRALLCATITLILRLIGMHYKFELPKVKRLEASPSQLTKERRK